MTPTLSFLASRKQAPRARGISTTSAVEIAAQGTLALLLSSGAGIAGSAGKGAGDPSLPALGHQNKI